MKGLIFVMLLLCFLAVLEVKETVLEVNATPEEKLQIVEQKKTELQVEEYLEKERADNKKRLLSLPLSEVSKEEKIPWMMVRAINSQYSKLFFIPFIVISFLFFSLPITRAKR